MIKVFHGYLLHSNTITDVRRLNLCLLNNLSHCLKRMTAGSQSALTFLIEAAPELPDPEYLQKNNQKKSRVNAATTDVWFIWPVT